jgi:hypothetical protein
VVPDGNAARGPHHAVPNDPAGGLRRAGRVARKAPIIWPFRWKLLKDELHSRSERKGLPSGRLDAWPKAEPAESFWSRLSLSTADENAADPEKRVPWQLPPTGSARGTIVRTEYLLNSFLSVVVESDREANVSGDFKVRFHFR